MASQIAVNLVFFLKSGIMAVRMVIDVPLAAGSCMLTVGCQWPLLYGSRLHIHGMIFNQQFLRYSTSSRESFL